jgi:hypothetical protein
LLVRQDYFAHDPVLFKQCVGFTHFLVGIYHDWFVQTKWRRGSYEARASMNCCGALRGWHQSWHQARYRQHLESFGCDLNVGGCQFDCSASAVTCVFGILSGIEVRRRKIVGPVKSELSVASQVPGDLGERVDVASQRGWQLLTVGLKDARHVVDARWFDERGPK